MPSIQSLIAVEEHFVMNEYVRKMSKLRVPPGEDWSSLSCGNFAQLDEVDVRQTFIATSLTSDAGTLRGRAPVLLVCGRSDAVLARSRQHAMAGKLRRSKEVIFAGEGHMLAMERPDGAAREVVLFHDSNAASALGTSG